MSEQIFKEKLLKLRSNLAYATKNNHSWSFSDEELSRLLKAKPKTLDELGKIKGFPRDGKRVKSYGKSIIDIFNCKDVKDFKVEVKGDKVSVTSEMKKSNAFGK